MSNSFFKTIAQAVVTASLAAATVLSGIIINESIAELIDPASSQSEALTIIEEIAQPKEPRTVENNQQLCRAIHKGIGFATVKNNELINFENIAKDSPIASMHRFELVKVNHAASAYQPWEIAPDNETSKAKHIRIGESISFFLESLKLHEVGVNCSFSGMPPAEDDNLVNGGLSYAAGRYKVAQLISGSIQASK